jgi:hypothetical protein
MLYLKENPWLPYPFADLSALRLSPVPETVTTDGRLLPVSHPIVHRSAAQTRMLITCSFQTNGLDRKNSIVDQR